MSLRDEHDLILRTVAVAAAALARLRQRVSGGGERLVDIVKGARTAQGELLGKDAGLLMMLDPESASHTIGDPDRLNAWADLLELESEALAKMDETVAAGQALQRVNALRQAAKRLAEKRGLPVSKPL
jgi:hypothetical protein